MVIKADHERIKTLLKDTITLLCRNGLSFKTEFSVEALIGITLDKEDVVLVSINEIIRSELGAKLAMAKAAEEKASERSEEHGDSGESPPCTPASTTNGRQYRKRKHSAGHGSQPNSPEDSHHSEGMDSEDRSYRKMSAGGMLGEESSSEPLNKKGIGESKLHPVKIKEDDTKDVVYIKEEIDTGDWPGGTQTQDSYSDANIQSAGTSNTQNDDNFDFLQSGSLVPVSSDSGPHQSWPDLMQSQATPSGVNISQSKLSSTMTGTVSGSQSDHSQQIGDGDGGHGAFKSEGHDEANEFAEEQRSSAPLFAVPTAPAGGKQKHRRHVTDATRQQPTDGSDAMALAAGAGHGDDVDGDRTTADGDPRVGRPAPTSAFGHGSTDPAQSGRPCPYCQKMLTSPRGFKLHIDAHRGIFPHTCSYCQRGFLSKTGLEGHLVQHTNKKMYMCTVCGKEFKYKHGLHYHHHVCPERKK